MEVLLVNILPAEWTSNEENHETTAAISQCREKVSPASAFLPVVNPASAFHHQGRSGTAGHELVQQGPALVIYTIY
jgi:hypothetical protein